MKNAKKTVYLYVGIIVLILMAVMFVFQIINYNNTIATYVASYGYEESYVKEMIPFWGTLMPEFSSIITSYGLFAVIAFGINSILNAIKNEDYVDDFDVEEFLESIKDEITDDDDDNDDKKEALEDVIEDAVEKAVSETVKNTENKQ